MFAFLLFLRRYHSVSIEYCFLYYTDRTLAASHRLFRNLPTNFNSISDRNKIYNLCLLLNKIIFESKKSAWRCLRIFSVGSPPQNTVFHKESKSCHYLNFSYSVSLKCIFPTNLNKLNFNI